MKSYLIGFLFLLSCSQAIAGEVLYCGGLRNEGASIKVEPEQNRMCFGGGPFAADFCSQVGARILNLVRVVDGSITINGASVSFREFLGSDATGSQLIRFYGIGAAVSSADIEILWADLNGNIINLNTPISALTNSNEEAKSGSPVCFVGDEDSF